MKGKLRSILFMGALLCVSLINILTPTKVFSNKEGRYLQRFPDISWDMVLSSKFGKDFEKYTSDQFVGRNNWISLKTISDLLMLKKDNGRVYFGKDDYLFNVGDEIDNEQLEKNIKDINTFIKSIMSYNKNIDICALLIPSKEEVLEDKLPSFAPVVDERRIIEDITSSLSSDIKILNLIDILNDKSNEYIYYKTDHHWTTLGAYYGYEHYLEAMGIKPSDKSEFTAIDVSNDFLGSNYRKSNFYRGNPDKISVFQPEKMIKHRIIINGEVTIDSLYDDSFLKKHDKYSYFLGGDKPLMEINTSIKNGKSILIIKDSFANSFIQILINHYENIFVIDPRYYNMSIEEFVKEKGINEILFLYNIQNFVQEKALSIISK